MIQGNVRMFFFVFANKNVLYRVKIYSILNGIFVCSFYKFATSATPAVTNKNIASPTTTASSIKKIQTSLHKTKMNSPSNSSHKCLSPNNRC